MPLTDHQELAAESRGGARLVSAAAGSGKTKVLVERLMRYVDRGADIDQFLVITYTRAAAAELRSRILSALGERIAADPMEPPSPAADGAVLPRLHRYDRQHLRSFSAREHTPRRHLAGLPCHRAGPLRRDLRPRA